MYILLDQKGNIIASDRDFLNFINSLFISEGKSNTINFSKLIHPKDQKKLLKCLSANLEATSLVVVYRLNDSISSWAISINQKLSSDNVRGEKTILCDFLPLNYYQGYNIHNRFQSKKLYHPFLPNFNDHGLIISYNRKIIYANEISSDILQLPHDKITKLSPKSIFPLNSLTPSHNKLIEVVLPSGFKKWLYLTHYSIDAIDGKLTYFIFYDSTYKMNLEEQLKIFKYIVDHAGMEFYLLDKDGNFVYVNEASARSLGYDLNTFKNLGIPHIDVLYTPEKFKQHFYSLKDGENQSFIAIHKHKDGRNVIKKIKSVYLEVGGREYIYGFGEDITEEKRIKEFLNRENVFSKILIQVAKNISKNSNEIILELLKNLLNITKSDYVSLFSTYLEDTSILDTPISQRHTTHLKKDDLQSFLFQTFQNLENKYFKDIPIFDAEVPIQILHEIKSPQGEIIKIYIAVIPIKNKCLFTDLVLLFRPNEEFSEDELNQLFFFANSAGDIVRRFQAEENLRKREKILEAVSKCSALLLRASEWQDEIQNVIAELGNSTGVSRCYIFKNKPSPEGTILTDQLCEWCLPGVTPQIDNPELQNFDYIENGFKRWVDILSLRQPIYGCVKDFPEEEREILLAQDIKSIAVVPIFVFDEWWGFIGFDECFEEKRWSSSEIHALNIASKMIGSAIERKYIQEILYEQRTRLESIEKLTSLGLMASGIAHEINNPLATISLGVQNLKSFINGLDERNTTKEEILEILKKIERNINRIENIIRGIKVFAQSEVDLKFEPYPVERIIKEAVEIISGRLTSDKIKLTLPNLRKSAKIEVIPALFLQVIVNLLENAIDAVKDVSKPNISVEISEGKDYVSISVIDNGIGIPPELLSRITEPFFTTKSKESRLGLGLAISKAILDIHGGRLNYESKNGETKFTLVMKKVI